MHVTSLAGGDSYAKDVLKETGQKTPRQREAKSNCGRRKGSRGINQRGKNPPLERKSRTAESQKSLTAPLGKWKVVDDPAEEIPSDGRRLTGKELQTAGSGSNRSRKKAAMADWGGGILTWMG